MCGLRWGEDNRALDDYISLRITTTEDMEDIVSKFSEALQVAYDKSFKKARPHTKTQNGALADGKLNNSARKRVNAFRMKYQRTKNNNNTREQRKMEYQAEKFQYRARIKNAKIQSWKQYCSKTLSTNPWNIVHKSAAGISKQ
jgi:hypothetical protein